MRARPHQLSARRVSRGARVEGHSALTMELSEYVQKGFQMLADPGSFDSNTFTLLLRAAFQSLLDAQADEAVLGKPLGSATREATMMRSRALQQRVTLLTPTRESLSAVRKTQHDQK